MNFDGRYRCGDHGTLDCASCIAKKYTDDMGEPTPSWYRRILNRKAAYRFVLARDGFRCRWCQRISVDRNRGKMTVEHVVPIARGGTNDGDNLCMAHAQCNLLKSDLMPDDPAWLEICRLLREQGFLPNSYGIRVILKELLTASKEEASQ